MLFEWNPKSTCGLRLLLTSRQKKWVELGCIDILFEVDRGAGESDGAVEAALEPAVACGESAELFEMAEAAFDAVACFVECAVVNPLHDPVAARRDHDRGSHVAHAGDDGPRVVAAVRNHGLRGAALQQRQGLGLFGGLAGREAKGRRLSKAVGQQVNLGAQPASASPQSLVFGAPFLRPAAACW